ncbi:auxin-responsive protein SAUR32-like [Rhodamnia argentea]|uniref:Auxin-responsive protein SAUR32-like n=1 Tax=Rhodamnia argentea TaxID=178133 RepID=A0A8B8QRS4_9MYRT|nr:auxin-responsive protein SAUR32-like [Rhodamnia argentea]
MMRSVNRYRRHHPGLHLHLPHIHVHHHHHHEREEGDNLKDVPRGCLAISVGQGEEERRFVIPVAYVNHPRFVDLLREAEDEYGFDQKGPINIPCHINEFRNVQDSIDKDASKSHRHDRHCNSIYGRCFGPS